MESIWNPIIYVRFTRLDQGQKVAYISTFLGSLFELLKRCQRVVNRSSTFINHLSAICWHWTAVRQLSDGAICKRVASFTVQAACDVLTDLSSYISNVFMTWKHHAPWQKQMQKCWGSVTLHTAIYIYIYICFIYSLYMFIFYNIIYASWTFQVCIESIGMPIVFNSKKEKQWQQHQSHAESLGPSPNLSALP